MVSIFIFGKLAKIFPYKTALGYKMQRSPDIQLQISQSRVFGEDDVWLTVAETVPHWHKELKMGFAWSERLGHR